MHTLIALYFLCIPFETEATTGLGGIVWEEPPETATHAMSSSSMTAWSARMRLQGPWWMGSSLLFNAYDGRYPDFLGPFFGIVDVMGYYRMEMGPWQLNLGAGIAAGALHVRRIRPEPSGDTPAGHYELLVPSVYASLSGAFLRRIHPRLLVGVSLRYYSGVNTGPCWQGPADDCEGVDRQTQHWAFGASIVIIPP